MKHIKEKINNFYYWNSEAIYITIATIIGIILFVYMFIVVISVNANPMHLPLAAFIFASIITGLYTIVAYFIYENRISRYYY